MGGPYNFPDLRPIARSVADLYRCPVGQSALRLEGQQTLWDAGATYAIRTNGEAVMPEDKIKDIGDLAIKASFRPVE